MIKPIITAAAIVIFSLLIMPLSPKPLLTKPSSPSPSPLPTIKLIFAGDMMFDRHIRYYAKSRGYDFILENLTNMLNQADLVIANLEGPITTYPSVSLGSVIGSPKNYTFTFDPQIIPTLTTNNLKLMNLGNNHILNYGKTGLDSTIKYLDEAGIDYFGNTGYPDHHYQIKTINDRSIGFVNYNQFVKDGEAACLADISQIKDQTDLIIVYAHWGNEYQLTNSLNQQQLAHQFIDAGADIIIGSHPHVVQNIEIYQGKTIYYSLGNFVFDQYFMPETQRGLLVKVEIDDHNNLAITEHRTLINKTGQINLDK